MTAIPLLSSIVGNKDAEFSQAYPINMEPVAVDNKIAKGQLKLTPGVEDLVEGPGIDRGSVLWNERCYRVMGTKLVYVPAQGAVVTIGDVGGSGPVSFAYSFDRLAVRSGTSLYYYDGSALEEITDIDLGAVYDLIWVDGYFMTIDRSSIVVTELSDPTQVDPLKYGSAEEDPDMNVGLIKARNEVYVMGRYTIEIFQNVGGNGFPFAKVDGATIPYGVISSSAKCNFAESFAFVGSAKNEGLAIFVSGQGTATKISTRAIDDFIASVPDPTNIVLENRTDRDENRLFVHTSIGTVVFLLQASRALEQSVWYHVTSGTNYRPRYSLDCYGGKMVGDTETGKLGWLSHDVDEHFGVKIPWQFEVGLIYNESMGGIVHSLELVGLPGRSNSDIFLSMTRNAEIWSNEIAIRTVKGDRMRRLQWRPHVNFGNYIAFRFRGHGKAGFARVDAVIEPLTV